MKFFLLILAICVFFTFINLEKFNPVSYFQRQVDDCKEMKNNYTEKVLGVGLDK